MTPKRRSLTVAVAVVVVVVATLLLHHPGRRLAPAPEIIPTDFQNLERYADRVTPAQLDRALLRLDPTGFLTPFLHLHGSRLAILADLDGALPAVQVPLATTPPIPDPASGPGLFGKHILLDPGHFGGAWAAVEKRRIQLDGGPPLREGDLTYGVARLLQERLERAGASVILSRRPPPTQPFAVDQYRRVLHLAADTDARAVFHAFNLLELRRRAAEATTWHADVTLSIHFNVCRWPGTDGIIVFIPGGFMPHELEHIANRYYAVRRALDATLPTDVRIGRAIAEALEAHMGLPALQPVLAEPPASNEIPIDPEVGVWARNLAVIKRAAGAALLVEGPCMNQRDEYQRLLQQDVLVDGHPYPERVEQYADALFEALSTTANGWRS